MIVDGGNLLVGSDLTIGACLRSMGRARFGTERIRTGECGTGIRWGGRSRLVEEAVMTRGGIDVTGRRPRMCVVNVNLTRFTPSLQMLGSAIGQFEQGRQVVRRGIHG